MLVDQQCIGPQLLGRSFQKQEISRQLVTRMQDSAPEFSKNFRGGTPGRSQQEGATPFPTQHPALHPLASKRSGVGTQTLPPQLFSRACASTVGLSYNFLPPI